MMIMSCLIVQVCIVPACKRKFVLVRKMLPRNYRAHKAASVHFFIRTKFTFASGQERPVLPTL